MEKILFDEKYCKIFYDDIGHFIHMQWFGFPKSDDFRKACNIAIDWMVKVKTHKFLTDNRNATLFGVKDQKWLNEEWLPRAEKAGYRASATLVNRDAFVKVAVTNISSARDAKKFMNKTFIEYNDAVEWLKTI